MARGTTRAAENQRFAPISHNYLLNGAFEIWQRGVTVNPSAADAYSADRWESYRGSFAAGMTCSRGTTTLLPGIRYHARVQRVAGNSSTQPLTIAQPLETAVARNVAGREVTLSFYARVGANFSANLGRLNVALVTGTGTDQNSRGGFTGSSLIVNTFVTPGTSWARYSFTAVVPDAANQVCPVFFFTPVGTAGAADHFDITGVQLELGPAATAFRTQHGSVAAELAACQRYYYRAVADGAGDVFGVGLVASATTVTAQVPFFTQMRAVPTLQSSPAGQYQLRHSGLNNATAVGLSGGTSDRLAMVDFTSSGMPTGYACLVRSETVGTFLGFYAEL